MGLGQIRFDRPYVEAHDESHRDRLSTCADVKICKMGVAASWMWSWLFPRKEYKIVVVGLDNAGKTTMLYKLYLGEVVITRPTVGSNVEEVKYRNLTFEVRGMRRVAARKRTVRGVETKLTHACRCGTSEDNKRCVLRGKPTTRTQMQSCWS